MQRRRLRRSIRRDMGMITLIAALSLSGGVTRLHLHTKMICRTARSAFLDSPSTCEIKD